MKNLQKGFIWLPIFIAIAVGLAVVGGGIYVYVQNKQGGQMAVTQSSDLKTYTDIQHGFEFKYPAMWAVTKTKDDEITLTSPNSEASDITFLISPIPGGRTLNINCQPSGGEDANSIVDGFHSEECKNLENTNGVRYARGINAGMSTEQTYKTRGLKGYFLNSPWSVIIYTILTNAAGNVSPSTTPVFDAILQSVKFTQTISTVQTTNSQTANWKTYRNKKYGFEFDYPDNWTLVPVQIGAALIPKKNNKSERVSISITAGSNRFNQTSLKTLAAWIRQLPNAQCTDIVYSNTHWCMVQGERFEGVRNDDYGITKENVDYIVRFNVANGRQSMEYYLPDSELQNELAVLKGVLSTFKFITQIKTNSGATTKSYCTADNYSVKEGVVYWGANPLKQADPATFKMLPPFSQDGGFDLCLAEDATHVFVSRDLVLPRPDHITYLPLQGTKNCNSYRVVDGLGVFEGVWLLAGADVHTFTDITPPDGQEEGMCYGKDAHQVYSATGYRAIAGADPNTFQVLNANYTRDTGNVWYRGGAFNNYGPIPTADANTFAVLSETWAKDRSYAYHMEKIIIGADPATFVALDDNHSKDANRVYDFSGKPLTGIDAKTTISLNNGQWLKDGMHVYTSDGGLVTQADPSSFSGLGGGYGKDANRVFYFGSYGGKLVQGADVSSFVVANNFYGKDNRHIYSGGQMLVDSDVNTFAQIDTSVYYKDIAHVWFSNEIGWLSPITGADPKTFVPTGTYEARDALHTYNFNARGQFYIDTPPQINR